MRIHVLLNTKKLLVPYNKLSVVYVNYESNIETSKCNISLKKKKKNKLVSYYIKSVVYIS